MDVGIFKNISLLNFFDIFLKLSKIKKKILMDFDEAKNLLLSSKKPGTLIKIGTNNWKIKFFNVEDEEIIAFLKKESKKSKSHGHKIKSEHKKLLIKLTSELEKLKNQISSNYLEITRIKKEQLYNPYISGDGYDDAMHIVKELENKNLIKNKRISEINNEISNFYI